MRYLLLSLILSSAALAQAPVARTERSANLETRSDYDQIRFRGGFSIGGAYAFGAASGPVASVGLRLGAQWNRYFGTYLQEQPTLFFVGNSNGVLTGYSINNSLLASLTLLDFFEVAAGPSLDYTGLAGCAGSEEPTCASASGLGFGVHGRAAIVLGGRNPAGGRRNGFSIGLDVHPVFLGNGNNIFFASVGLGGDWM